MSKIIKRSVAIAGHSTSVSLEAEFWDVLKDIALKQGISTARLIGQVDKNYGSNDRRNLSSSLRVYVLTYLLNQKGL